MSQSYQDWLPLVLQSAYAGGRAPSDTGKWFAVDAATSRHGPDAALMSVRHLMDPDPPLTKMLFSATLTSDPDTIAALCLRAPRCFRARKPADAGAHSDAVAAADGMLEEAEEGEEGETRSYVTPTTLVEHMVVVRDAGTKPLALLHLLLRGGHTSGVLVFTAAVETTHRLCALLRVFGGLPEVREFSSRLSQHERAHLVAQFAAGQVAILVCSDAMSRGIDVAGVNCVISYDAPAYMRTYIHRVGRTARAGRTGAAITIVRRTEVRHFKMLMRKALRPVPHKIALGPAQLDPLTARYEVGRGGRPWCARVRQRRGCPC